MGIFLIFFQFFMCICCVCCGEILPRLPDIYWNSSNQIFRIDNTDHIIDVNRGNRSPFEYDQVNIICPTYPQGTREEDTESYIIYNVSKEEYDSCRVINSNARIIALCDKPHYAKYFTITFRSFTPQPGGLEFKPGQDYYFITTSTGRAGGLNQKVGGRCSTHHMKMIFKVCCSSNNSNDNDKNESSSNTSNGFAKEQQLNSSTSSSSSFSLPFPSPSDLNGLDFHKNTLLNKITNISSSNNPSIIVRQNGADSFTINNNDLRGSQSGQPIDSHSVFSNSNSVNIVNPNRLETVSNDRMMITNHSNQKINSGGSRSASSLFSSPSPILPTSPTSYWWRPHFTKLPSLKHNNDVNNLRPGASESDGRLKNGSNGWVIIIGSAVGVTIACVVICALFACTNYLFFPPRRKQQLSKC
ncbi:uncharacterized protein LOC141858715 [Brevipalpus obovatus]|uniref:uncharacterized protein LOC141858715 n=1 Tax=Brevipalpus obovatus TaxID=246614 RepID=UPI003D9F6A19